MSTNAPPPAAKSVPGPLAPPEEQFWEKYSPHYEFPLSSVGSVAMHIAALVLFLGALWMLSRMTFSDKTPVAMRAMTVIGDEGDGAGKAGSGGGTPKEDVTPFQEPMERSIPEAKINETLKDLQNILPKVSADSDAPRPEDLDAVKKIARLDDAIRQALGKSGNRGSGPGDGSGTSGVPGTGSNNAGDATSSQSRGVRWELIFRTADGRDYLNQLAAMKATVVIPYPPDWKTSKAFKDVGRERVTPEEFNRDQLPDLYFVDDEAGSPGKVAKALGLNFEPPVFIAFFPKEIEEELAAKERAFRNRKESEIFSTKFKVLIRDGKLSITVVDQIPVKR